MNSLDTNPLCSMKFSTDKSMKFSHSDKEFDEVLEDGLKLNDQVLKLKKQIELQSQDHLALIARNRQLEIENAKLKAMLGDAQDDYAEQEGAPESDMVNEPPHYKQHAMECIDEMVEVFGVEAVTGYCMCNVWKYRYRAPFKGKLEEDNAKADWYMHAICDLREYGRVHYFKVSSNHSENEPDDD